MRTHLSIRAAQQLIQLIQHHHNSASCTSFSVIGDVPPQLSQGIRCTPAGGHRPWPKDRVRCHGWMAPIPCGTRGIARRRLQTTQQVLVHGPRVPQVHAVDGYEQRRQCTRLGRVCGALPDDFVHGERLACGHRRQVSP